MRKLIKGTAVLGAIALGAASTILTAGAATTGTTTGTTTTPTTTTTIPTPMSAAPQTTTSDATLTTTTPLTLGAAPTISFGSQLYSVSKQTYASTAISPLKITNPGFSSGWTLTAAATPFTSSATPSSTLQGATFTLDGSSADPITADDSTNVSKGPTYVTPVTLTSTATEIEGAAAGAGVGAYTTNYDAGDASLYVPAGNLQGAYTSTVTWTLSDAPS